MEWTTIAACQAGVISRRQLIGAGYPAGQIESMLRYRRLAATEHAGVYRAPGTPPSGEAAQFAAVLGTNGTLSHLSAAAWWGMEVPDDGQIHVIAATRRSNDVVAGVRVHRIPLPKKAITRRLHMPITTRARTVIDCLRWLDHNAASTLLDRALQKRWIDTATLDTYLHEFPGRRGNAQLRQLVTAAASGARSAAERLMVKTLKANGIEGWRANVPVMVGGRTYEVDFSIEATKTVIEIDGWSYHHAPDRFQHDRTKQNALTLAGWTVLRFTWWDLRDHPEWVVAQIRARLTSRVSANR